MFDRKLHEARLWAARQAGDITHAALNVGLVLCRYVNHKGRCWPSMETLAAGAGCSTRTVQRAVNALRDAGLLVWVSEWARWNRRDSNRYTLLNPEKHVGKQRDKTSFRGFPAIVSYGSPSKPLGAALSRLAAALGCPQAALPAWLSG